MGKTVEYADGEPVKMKKKSKKNKDITNDLLPSSDGNGNVETDGDHVKKKKKDKHKEKKKSESEENGETNGDRLKKKKKDKHREKKRTSESEEDGETKDDHLMKKNKNKYSEKKRKFESKEDDEDQVENVPKKSKKQKSKHYSEEAHIKENEQDQDDGLEAEENCNPKPEKQKKKKKKIEGQSSDTETNMEDKSIKKQKVKVKGHKLKNKAIESVQNNTEKPKSKSKSKKVSFSGHVEVFPASDTEQEKQTTNGDSLVRGKRFTPEEDEIVKQAVLDYITAKGLGDDGLKMVLNCKSQKGLRNCWREIGLCIPYRPHMAVYYRAHILFERSEKRSWTQEEIKMLKELQEKHGNDWKKIAAELGKHRFHVKDTWRRTKLENLKRGRWSQEEYQQLYDLVNLDLQMKVSGEEKKKSKHGMLRDNIPFTAISEKLSTRSDSMCCAKWYDQLTSSLVVEKKWADADDYRMIGALYELDAACAEDVDWDNVLEHRPGEICLKRWNQMVKHIGDYASKTFSEQVDILAKRYVPDLAETREAWDSKPVVP